VERALAFRVFFLLWAGFRVSGNFGFGLRVAGFSFSSALRMSGGAGASLQGVGLDYGLRVLSEGV